MLVETAASPALPFDVVAAKIQVPRIAAATVSRTALVNRLRAAGAFPLVLVVAPAGYGKTTLLSQWADRDARPFVWVSIDEHDNEPIAFLRHVAAALDGVRPLDASALESLRPTTDPSGRGGCHASPPRFRHRSRRSCSSSTAPTCFQRTRSRLSPRCSSTSPPAR